MPGKGGSAKLKSKPVPAEEIADSDSEDSSVDEAVQRVLSRLQSNNSSSNTNKDDYTSSSFFKLSEKIMSPGRIGGVDLQRSLELHAQTAGNKIEEAQRSSSLYDRASLTAPPLKKQKEEKKKTLGRGWFDLQVRFALCIPCLVESSHVSTTVASRNG